MNGIILAFLLCLVSCSLCVSGHLSCVCICVCMRDFMSVVCLCLMFMPSCMRYSNNSV